MESIRGFFCGSHAGNQKIKNDGPENVSILFKHGVYFTPPKFNIALEKWWLDDYFPFGMVYFQGLC